MQKQSQRCSSVPMDKKMNACIILVMVFWCFSSTTFASGFAYLEKFMAYQQWSQHLPTKGDTAFEHFIDDTSPLAKKLREKWLYQLAYNKDWPGFIQYYRPSNDLNLKCYYQLAHYQLGHQEQALENIADLWLSGRSQPKACDALFTMALQQRAINDTLIRQRITLALVERNRSLARYLLKQLHPAKIEEANLLNTIYQQPLHILRLEPSDLNREFYLYGLKLLVQHNPRQAMLVWNNPKTKRILTEQDQQAFIAYLAVFKAVRNQPDADQWFAQIKPAFATEATLEWHIRYCIAHHQWQRVIGLIQRLKSKDEPIWVYWTARSHAELNHTEQATLLFQDLAQKRNYYGFLASLKLNQRFNFQNEQPHHDLSILQDYKPITDRIQALYQNRQALAASRLLNDFVLELSKEEKSALAHWVENHLKWYGKSVNLSNNDELNNQLALRFPLAYHDVIHFYSKQYQLTSALVYAMIRQESAFRDDIASPAGAQGLMQIMPRTAKFVAKQAKIPYQNDKQLYSLEKNIHIGTAYLQQLARQFHAHPLLMAAAYNAGPGQVNRWLKFYPTNDIDVWIECLPWQETRNYLKNVIAFYAVYQYRMQETPNVNPFLSPLRG